MFTRRVLEDNAAARRWPSAVIAALGLLVAAPVAAQDPAPMPISIGAGMRTSFVHTHTDDEGDAEGSPFDNTRDRFLLDSARLYVSGPVTSHVSFMFNTEYDGGSNDIGIMDAVARFELSERFNIWAGRFLPPSDRANLYGPYYAHHWAVYTDGIQDGYPFIFQGRANGIAYWGQFGKVKLSGGAFDGPTLTTDDDALLAGRVQVDFWDPEPGYYLNGTYYGDKNLLALGVAGQVQGEDRSAYNVDFLLERMTGGGAYTLEAQWNRYDSLGGYDSRYTTSDGGYVLGAYLFPGGGPGRWEVLGKYAHARFRDGLSVFDPDYDQKTTEFNLNYVIEQFNARLMIFVKDTRFDAVRTDFVQAGLGIQIQM